MTITNTELKAIASQHSLTTPLSISDNGILLKHPLHNASVQIARTKNGKVVIEPMVTTLAENILKQMENKFTSGDIEGIESIALTLHRSIGYDLNIESECNKIERSFFDIKSFTHYLNL